MNDTSNISAGQSRDFDFWYNPQQDGQNVEVKAKVNGTSQGVILNDSRVKMVNVTRTRQLNLTFVPLFGPQNFNLTKNDNIEFLNRTYPVSDSGILTSQSEEPLEQLTAATAGGLCLLIHQVTKNTLLFSDFTKTSFERAVIILPDGWVTNTFGFLAGGGRGIYCGPLPIVAFEEGFRHGAAHEIGHSYGLCDEYNSSIWSQQNNPSPLITNQCPNGDSDNNEVLDTSCLDQQFYGCDTTTIEKLIPWSLPVSYTAENLTNFMGSSEAPNLRWISNDSYKHLLKQFSHTSPEFSNKRLLVSGTVNKTSGEIQFDPFYTLGAGFADNSSELIGGNYTVETLDNLSNKILNLSFNLTFKANFINGSTVDINVSPFLFVIPFNSSVAQILIKSSQTIKDQVNVSPNAPLVNITFPLGGESFSNRFNISWNASDADGDNLSYAILFSSDNGSVFSSLKVDYNQTTIEIDSTNLSDCKNTCRVMVIATDGVNNGNSTSRPFNLDNNLNISSFGVVYSNQTERVFEIQVNNTLDTNLSNISWSLDTGNEVISSLILYSLKPSEQIFIFVYHNYSASGNYSIIFSAFNNHFLETEIFQLAVP